MAVVKEQSDIGSTVDLLVSVQSSTSCTVKKTEILTAGEFIEGNHLKS